MWSALPDSEIHSFDDALELTGSGEKLSGRTTPEYANMVGPFGGATAAVVVRAIQRHPDVIGDPVSLTVNFLGPISYGDFDLSVRPVRTNRATQHWSVEIGQDGAAVTTATAVFGFRRSTWSATEATVPSVPDAETIAEQSFPDVYAWPQNYEMRFVEGGLMELDGSENSDSVSTLWLRDKPVRPLDFPALTSMADAFYPRIFRRLGRPTVAGTVSMTTYFHADAATLAAYGTDYILGTARGQAFGAGYFDQTAQLWGVGKNLLATSHQVVYFKG